MNSCGVFCKHHNYRISCADSTSTRALFFAVNIRAESGALDSNKLEEQESLSFVLDVTLCHSYSTSRGVTWVTTAMYNNVLKPQDSWLHKQSGHIPHVITLFEMKTLGCFDTI